MKHVATTVLIIAAVLVSTVQAAQAHSTGEIRQAAQAWVDAGAPYDQLTPSSRQLVSRSTWASWVACGGGTRGMVATVRGHGNDLAVVRFTHGGHTEWTAFYRAGRWTYELPGVDVAYLRTHTPVQVAHCA